jgi:WD40 repeat protein
VPGAGSFGRAGSGHLAAFSPDGSLLLTASKDSTAQLWTLGDWQPVGPPLRHQGPVTAVAFSPDRKVLITGSTDKTARLWDARTGKLLGPPLVHRDLLQALAPSPDGKILLTTSGEEVDLWDVETGKALGPPLPHQGAVLDSAFSPDGRTVATGSADRILRVWTVPRPVRGDAERIRLWVQTLTMMELDEHGLPRRLDVSTWRERREQLERLGGPPAPWK